jgi:hypothetical protein
MRVRSLRKHSKIRATRNLQDYDTIVVCEAIDDKRCIVFALQLRDQHLHANHGHSRFDVVDPHNPGNLGGQEATDAHEYPDSYHAPSHVCSFDLTSCVITVKPHSVA